MPWVEVLLHLQRCWRVTLLLRFLRCQLIHKHLVIDDMTHQYNEQGSGDKHCMLQRYHAINDSISCNDSFNISGQYGTCAIRLLMLQKLTDILQWRDNKDLWHGGLGGLISWYQILMIFYGKLLKPLVAQPTSSVHSWTQVSTCQTLASFLLISPKKMFGLLVKIPSPGHRSVGGHYLDPDGSKSSMLSSFQFPAIRTSSFSVSFKSSSASK